MHSVGSMLRDKRTPSSGLPTSRLLPGAGRNGVPATTNCTSIRNFFHDKESGQKNERAMGTKSTNLPNELWHARRSAKIYNGGVQALFGRGVIVSLEPDGARESVWEGAVGLLLA